MYIEPQLFREVADRARARQMFKANVQRVEIETHSYCNRRCSYCPNVVGDRLGANVRMADDTWETIVGNLEDIDYSEVIALNYYNEPLADRMIIERVRELRRRVPKSRIQIYTNGDYLDRAYVDELAAAGLTYLHISIHLKQGDTYSDMYVLNRIIEICVRAQLPAKLESIRTGEYAMAKVPHPTMEIEIRGINFQEHGTDRGGLIKDISTMSKRTAPCHFVFSHFVVGYDGTVVPCCHIRGDRPEHSDYTYGKLGSYGSIYQAYAGVHAAAWRRELGGDQEKRSPCDTCAAGRIPEPASEARFVELNKMHSQPDPAVALTTGALLG